MSQWRWSLVWSIASTALPIAWHIVEVQAQGSWIDYFCRLLRLLARAVPATVPVHVLCDQGLGSPARGPRLWHWAGIPVCVTRRRYRFSRRARPNACVSTRSSWDRAISEWARGGLSVTSL